MSDAAISMLILAVTVVLFVWNRYPVELVAIASALALYFTGVIDLTQMLSGFSDAAVVMIAALFIVSEGLDVSGVTAWAGQQLAAQAKGSASRVLLLTMLLVAVLTALIGLNGAVAALLPMTVVLAMRLGMPTSRLLMPLAFAGSAGGMMMLTGSPVNVVVSQAASDAGLGEFGLFEFALVGVPLLVGTIAIVMLLGRALLPERTSSSLPPNLSTHARTLVEHYSLDKVFHLRVERGSELIGTTRPMLLQRSEPGIRFTTIFDELAGKPVSTGTVAPNDRITALGDLESIDEFASYYGLSVLGGRGATEVSLSLLNRNEGVIEAVIPPRSKYVDMEVQPGSVIGGSMVALAIQRDGVDRSEDDDARLRTGDVLLLEGPWSSLDAAEQDNDVLVVNAPDLIRRQAVPRGMGSTRALVILIAMVVLLASGLFPPVVAALLAAGAMILSRVVSAQDVYRKVSWSTVFMVAGMFPMSIAIQESGAGAMIAEALVNAVGDAGPTALLAGLSVITLLFGQLISNTATALVMIPIALAAADQLGVSGRPVLMAVCVAASAAFLTPVATPANMMVMGPGGYRFGDYWKLGLPLMVLFFVASVFLVPVIWPF